MTENTNTEKLAANVAAEIRRRGHWQHGVGRPGALGTCVVLAADRLGATPEEMEALSRRVLKSPPGFELPALWRWNDSTPTAEVLATLDSIAAAPAVIAAAESVLGATV